MMNKKQIRIGWWGIILISIVLVLTGISVWDSYHYEESILPFIVLTFISPIVLLFGFGIYTAGIKSKNNKEKL